MDFMIGTSFTIFWVVWMPAQIWRVLLIFVRFLYFWAGSSEQIKQLWLQKTCLSCLQCNVLHKFLKIFILWISQSIRKYDFRIFIKFQEKVKNDFRIIRFMVLPIWLFLMKFLLRIILGMFNEVPSQNYSRNC